MKTIAEQLAYERSLVDRGAALYYEAQDALREKGRVEDTDAVRALFRHNGGKLIVAIQTIVEHYTNQSPYKRKLVEWLELIPYAKLAYFTQFTVMRVIDTDNKENLGVRYVTQRIGEMVETEAKCIAFDALNPDYYRSIQESFNKDNVNSYEHKRKVISAKFADVCNNEWDSWGMQMRVGIGAILLKALLLVMEDLIYVDTVWVSAGKSKHVLRATVEFDEWLGDYEHARGLRTPYRMPMQIPPKPWGDTYSDGGYYTKHLQYATPFVSPVGKRHKDFINRFNPRLHKAAANKLQNVPMRINQQVWAIVQHMWEHGVEAGLPSRKQIYMPECPEHISRMLDLGVELSVKERTEFLAWKSEKKQTHRDEVRRRALVRSMINTLNAAAEVEDWDEFYYVWTADFRGRLYPATAALFIQGHESARALLEFKNAKPIGESGRYWLAAHGGGLFGIKGDADERIAWVVENQEFIRYIAEHPMECTWKDADKPLQFMAWCLEWAKCDYGTNLDYKSHWIGGIDGTNNGLQHLSAMARDTHGAFITNLTSCPEKQDAYKKVAEAMLRALNERTDGVAEMWRNAAPGRDLAKMPMMVLVYGASKQTCRKHCIDWVHENCDRFPVSKDKLFDIAMYGADVLWEAIEREIPLVIQLMEWLQANSSGRFVAFISPAGFPVYQYYMKAEMKPVYTQLAGIASLTAYDLDDEKAVPHNIRQRNGIVPNLVHACDSTHLAMVVVAAPFEVTCVHDEFMAHVCDIEQLQSITVREFYNLHKTDVLKEWARQQGIGEEYLPERGNYDINDVLASKHLFE